jgi:hypothetical protein
VPGRGVVLPSPVVVLTVIAVAMAAIAFVATRGSGPEEREVATPVRGERTTPAAPAPTTTTPPPKPKPKPIRRGKVLVEVYNNSGITGLAAEVAGKAGDAGWNVVGADNWYGTIPATTVYFPPGKRRAAKQLALDLGIERTARADEPMKLDRLTVILTGAI